MNSEQNRTLVMVDDGILEVQKTGLVVVCDKTNAELHVLHFRNEGSGLAGMAIGREMEDVADAYKEGRYTAVHPEFEPSTLQRDRYARAQMSGQQGLRISQEIRGDYTLLGVYMQGLEGSIEDSNAELRELVQSGSMATPQGIKEAQALAEECDRLEHLKADARAIRDGLSEMAKSYHLGYRMDDPTPEVLGNPELADSYALGLTIRTGELKDIEGTNWDQSAVPGQLERAHQLYAHVQLAMKEQLLNPPKPAQAESPEVSASAQQSPGM